LDTYHSKNSYCGSLSYWKGVSGGVLRGSALDLLLFNSFINNLGDGMENMLIKFAGDTALGVVGCTLESTIRIQNDLEKLNDKLDISKMKFSKHKFRGRNQMYKYKIISLWVAVWQERS